MSERPQHLARYDDYGTGIWLLISADSAEVVEERVPGLQVHKGPTWLNSVELLWIEENALYDLDEPTGWLAELVEN